MTPEEIEAKVRTDHPEFRVGEGDEVTIISPETDPETYEAMIAERVEWLVEAEEVAADVAAEKTRADQVKLRYDALKAGTATAKQTQEVVAHLLRQRYQDLTP